MPNTIRFLIACLLLSTLWAARAEAQEGKAITFPYVVQKGEGCAEIAQRFFGDRNKYTLLHQYNDLGPTPHNLKPGQVLMIPMERKSPEAELSGLWGPVKAQSPSDSDWRAASRGMDLFRAWRVNSEEKAGAELTFRDSSQLQMRENTIVIVYGGSRTKSQRMLQHAELETGALRSRLGELSGDAADSKDPDAGNLQVMTPSGIADLDKAEALVTVDNTKVTRVANHGKKPVQFSARTKQARPITVDPDMGSKVAPDQAAPEPQRPLPPIPQWGQSPRRFVALGGKGTLKGSWTKVDKARQYRLEIWREQDGAKAEVIQSRTISADATAFEVQEALPGLYKATVSSIDDDQFESRPSEIQTFELFALDVVPLGLDRAFAVKDPDDIWIGASIFPPEGVHCRLGDAPAASTIALNRAGDARLSCVDDAGLPLPEIALQVRQPDIRLHVDTQGPLTRGQATPLAFEVSADFKAPFEIEVSEGVGVEGLVRVGPGLWQATFMPGSAAPEATQIRFLLGSGADEIELATVEVAVTAPPDLRSPWRLAPLLGYSTFLTAEDIGEPALRHGASAGLSFGYDQTEALAVELDVALFFALAEKRSGPAGKLTSASYRAQLIWEVKQRKSRPFLLLGAGGQSFFGGDLGTIPEAHTGIGVIFASGLRLESTLALGLNADAVVPRFELRLGFDFDL